MSDEPNLVGTAFVAGVALLNLASVAGCLTLLYFRLRTEASEPPFLTGVWWFVVVSGALAVAAMVFLYFSGTKADKYSGMVLLGVLPYFAPIALAGVVSYFLKR